MLLLIMMVKWLKSTLYLTHTWMLAGSKPMTNTLIKMSRKSSHPSLINFRKTLNTRILLEIWLSLGAITLRSAAKESVIKSRTWSQMDN